MFDLHCHMLPCFDDGASTKEEALSMADRASAEGLSAVVVTPHYIEGELSSPSADKIRKATTQLQEMLSNAKIELRIYPGMEVYFSPLLPRLVQDGKLLTVNGNGSYLLVELPLGELPLHVEETFFSLKVYGVNPVLAHPERCMALCENPELLAQWIEKDLLLVQINSGSLAGLFGNAAKKAANLFLQRDMVHCIASDAHSSKHPFLSRAYSYVADNFNSSYANLLCIDNPQRIINGDKVPAAIPQKLSRLSLLKSNMKNRFFKSF